MGEKPRLRKLRAAGRNLLCATLGCLAGIVIGGYCGHRCVHVEHHGLQEHYLLVFGGFIESIAQAVTTLIGAALGGILGGIAGAVAAAFWPSSKKDAKRTLADNRENA